MDTLSEKRKYGRMANRNKFDDIHQLLEEINIYKPNIVDGGAFEGSTIANFLKSIPNGCIHSFEANPHLHNVLNHKFRELKNVCIYNKALGASSKRVRFNITNYGPSSSLLLPNLLNRSIHKHKMDILEEVEIDMIRLDSLDVIFDVIKLDLQGYELYALEGLGELIKNVSIILTEIEFVELYEGQPLFQDIAKFLQSKGFYIFNLYELYTHPKGQLTAGDAIFINSRYFNKLKFIQN